MNYRHDVAIRRSNLHYWQVDVDPGQRIPHLYFEQPNRTMKTALLCHAAFGRPCPSPEVEFSSNSATGNFLLFASFGRLTNCLLVFHTARWIAEQLGKTLVVPLCASAENTEQSCLANSQQPEHKELNLLVSMTEVYDKSNMGSCQLQTPAVDIREIMGSQFMESASDTHTSSGAWRPAVRLQQRQQHALSELSCVGHSATRCSWMLAINHQYAGLRFARFINFDVGLLMQAWSEYASSLNDSEAKANAWAADALRKTLQRQDAGEPCMRHSLSDEGCACTNSSQRDDGSDAAIRAMCVRGIQRLRQTDARASIARSQSPISPPCLRNCRGVSVFDATHGNIFVPTLFEHSELTNAYRYEPCKPLELSKRAAAQAATLRKSLPTRFVCVHWRAADFLSPEPLSRLHGKSLRSQFGALGNATFMAAASLRAARNTGVSHILVLTNAKWEKTRLFEDELERLRHAEGGLHAASTTVTMRTCTDAPPDAEKHVCAHDGSGLLLSRSSSFSTHIHRMARAREAPPPVEYISSCPSITSVLWNRSTLLAGRPLPCS